MLICHKPPSVQLIYHVSVPWYIYVYIYCNAQYDAMVDGRCMYWIIYVLDVINEMPPPPWVISRHLRWSITAVPGSPWGRIAVSSNVSIVIILTWHIICVWDRQIVVPTHCVIWNPCPLDGIWIQPWCAERSTELTKLINSVARLTRARYSKATSYGHQLLSHPH